ncbi:hypothetical protein IQ07DRAFT_9285 [Pyrenochaeta sp. DS3sAY3a]|nr:hypothetical protein IQ07DRAFT_9285 [Pyrenochaeta sp. DS3sAY3a]
MLRACSILTFPLHAGFPSLVVPATTSTFQTFLPSDTHCSTPIMRTTIQNLYTFPTQRCLARFQEHRFMHRSTPPTYSTAKSNLWSKPQRVRCKIGKVGREYPALPLSYIFHRQINSLLESHNISIFRKRTTSMHHACWPLQPNVAEAFRGESSKHLPLHIPRPVASHRVSLVSVSAAEHVTRVAGASEAVW